MALNALHGHLHDRRDALHVNHVHHGALHVRHDHYVHHYFYEVLDDHHENHDETHEWNELFRYDLIHEVYHYCCLVFNRDRPVFLQYSQNFRIS